MQKNNPMKIRRLSMYLFQWGAVVLLHGLTYLLNTPFLLIWREEDIWIVMAGTAFLLILSLFPLYFQKPTKSLSWERYLFLAVLISAPAMAVSKEWNFHHARHQVMDAPEEQLHRLGRHFMVGYQEIEQVRTLVTKGAIGGIFITQHNIASKTLKQVQTEIKELQDLQASNGLPPLFVATDQEGGVVSRMSPLLSSLPPLATVVQKAKSPQVLENQVKHYGSVHGKELAQLGVNVNFSPVVDLQSSIEGPIIDFHTQINQRAIAEDPNLVGTVAFFYSQALEASGVIPTLKHFPGLGKVQSDTHLFSAELDLSVEELQKSDWIPFQHVTQKTQAWMMLGHVILPQIDPKSPVSLSQPVIQEVIRKAWGYNGVLITDDLNMGSISKAADTIGTASVQALNAGVDLLLISYDGDQYFEAMDAVIQAENTGVLNQELLKQSVGRLQVANIPQTGGIQFEGE